MKARNMTGQAPGGKRTVLAEILPLDTPLVVQFFPIYACNFKCSYCIFSIPRNKRHFISDKVAMEFDLFKKCIDDIALLPNRVKVLRIVGIGEPLLHQNISGMVQYAVSKRVANTVEILTNGSLLTPKLSDALISAGLSRLVVSLQGTGEKTYKKVCGTRIDFKKFVANLKYFFENKLRTQMYLKIVDCGLKDKEDEQKFYQTFGDICDTIAIEHAVPIHSGVPYETILKNNAGDVTQFGLPITEVEICPQSFFTLQINPDGKVVPCYSFEYPMIMGDCNTESVTDIWNGTKFQQFRRKTLDGSKSASEICAKCNIIKYRMFPEDVLNHDADRLKLHYNN